jgi:hypothetical protein
VGAKSQVPKRFHCPPFCFWLAITTLGLPSRATAYCAVPEFAEEAVQRVLVGALDVRDPSEAGVLYCYNLAIRQKPITSQI